MLIIHINNNNYNNTDYLNLNFNILMNNNEMEQLTNNFN